MGGKKPFCPGIECVNTAFSEESFFLLVGSLVGRWICGFTGEFSVVKIIYKVRNLVGGLGR